MNAQPFDDEQISHMIGFFADRLNLVFTHFFCTIEFDGDEDFAAPPTIKNARALRLRMIRNACLHTTLLALRDLDDVLDVRRPKKWPTDLKISDFGFPHSLGFLGKSERDSINTIIAHSTIPSAKISYRWDAFELTSKCIRQSIAFLEWIEKNRDWSSALFCRTGIQSTYDYVAKELKKIQIGTSL